MAQVKTSYSHEYNNSRTTSYGSLDFDNDGISQELPDDVALKLSTVSNSLSLVGEVDETVVDKEKEVKIPLAKKEVEVAKTPETPVGGERTEEVKEVEDTTPAATEETTEVVESEEDKAMRVELEGMTNKAIKAMLKDAGVPRERRDEFVGKESKPALIAFTIETINKSK